MIKLSLKLNKTTFELYVDEMKPLSQILYEDLNVDIPNRNCNSNVCGNCLVIVDKEPFLSCLIPAYRLQGTTITTFEAFMQSAHYRNIRRTYDALNSEPCPTCYEAKTLIIESMLLKAKTKRIDSKIDDLSRKFLTKAVDEDEKNPIDLATADREFSLNSCNCLTSKALYNIVIKALKDRIKRRVL
jgi:aerobic-type carbon monoxide dehydrogenase small subunit (CoxS/CutS family)